MASNLSGDLLALSVFCAVLALMVRDSDEYEGVGRS